MMLKIVFFLLPFVGFASSFCPLFLHEMMGNEHVVTISKETCPPGKACKVDYDQLYGPDQRIRYRIDVDGQYMSSDTARYAQGYLELDGEVTVRSSSHMYEVAKEKLMDHNGEARRVFEGIYESVEGRDSARSVQYVDTYIDPASSSGPALLFHVGEVIGNAGVDGKPYEMRIESLQEAEKSLAEAGAPKQSEAQFHGRNMVIASSVPGEPILPHEISLAQQSLEAMAAHYPPGVPLSKLAGAFSVFKVVPDPRPGHEGEKLIFHFDPASSF